MTMLNEGIRGAKRQSWRAANPRELLYEIMTAHPNWNRERLLTAFREKIATNEDFVATIIEYATRA